MATWEDLDNEEVWRGNQITELEDDYLVNLKGYLLRHATGFHRSMILAMYSFSSTLGGEMARDAIDSEIFEAERQHPLVWMEQRPILQAINREIWKRLGYSTCRIIETE